MFLVITYLFFIMSSNSDICEIVFISNDKTTIVDEISIETIDHKINNYDYAGVSSDIKKVVDGIKQLKVDIYSLCENAPILTDLIDSNTRNLVLMSFEDKVHNLNIKTLRYLTIISFIDGKINNLKIFPRLYILINHLKTILKALKLRIETAFNDAKSLKMFLEQN